MRTVFLTAVIVGFGATLAGAHYLPWGAHARLPSQTSVVANGGRAESFVIRLPADRIASTDGQVGGLRSIAGSAAAMPLPAAFSTEPLLVEHFKVRDTAGSVIGVAARHWSTTPRGTMTTWSVLIPSRGALLLTAPGEAGGALEAGLQKAGYNAGAAWEGQVAVTMTPNGKGGLLAGGSGEFDGFGGNYREVWTLTGIGTDGELRGTIELATVASRSP